MTVQTVSIQDKNAFNKVAGHPLQSWEWGEFREKCGIQIVRLGAYDSKRITQIVQLSLHQLPHTKWKIGYVPRGTIPSEDMIKKLLEVGKEYSCIFIKFEPNTIIGETASPFSHPQLVVSKHPLFTRYSFHLDLTQNEETLFKNMHPKTRYNIRVAQKHNVIVTEDSSREAFQQYLLLTQETTKRQKYFAHTPQYHTLMWETLSKQNIAHLMTAKYTHNGKTYTLVSWILFLFHDVLYYPYGASSSLFRNTMASNAIMWEAIRFGKKHNAKLFDMWGAMGPNPDPKDPWYGFHRFKQGYGTQLVEFIGSYDLVIQPNLYRLYNNMYKLRSAFLTLKRSLS